MAKAGTTARGYGTAHMKVRAEYKRQMAEGQVFYCGRCRGWVNPDLPWDLDHSDQDRTQYLGPSHVRCNRATAGRRKTQPPRRWIL